MFKITIFPYHITITVFLFLIPIALCKSQDFNFKGQLSLWGTGIRSQNEWNGNSGIRYIPQFNFNLPLNENDLLNTEVMFNTYYKTTFSSSDHAFKSYRAILRYTTEQTETQFGLQKIDFGTARLLRSLMWFDWTDPRDPLKLTDGVYALRYKYSFLDNSLLWFWCLYGNKDNKGYELFPTAKKTPEFGGRIQLPLLSGEIAATFHTRKVDAIFNYYRENRYALDGQWDIGIGVWFESVWQQNNSIMPIFGWTNMTTIGADYTIPEGNGIYILAEHMITTYKNLFLKTDQDTQISVMMITYPVGVLDNISLQEYYDWHNKNLYQYLQFQRTYDNFIINLALFHYPENGGNLFLNSKTAVFSGYGFQFILVFNY
ncbi:MAG: hypothetical protein JXA06_13175 [Bacteroidetes bacterium]|nr:hypothetical protein [Bacteroidota bacterium]